MEYIVYYVCKIKFTQKGVYRMNSKVKEIREEIGMTQLELSKRSGLSRQCISAIENGRSNVITNTTMEKIASVLNESVETIFFADTVNYSLLNKKRQKAS